MAGTSWPALIAGRKARASDVELKFDWIEGSIVPMSGGSITTGVHDLGTTTGYWRGAYINGLNPTTTANGVAFGTTTVANNSDVGLEVAGIRAVLMPRLTTTQRGNLAGINGMMIYNSTANQLQKYENGAWSAMGGSPIGLVAKVTFGTNSATTQTALQITASGRILGTTFNFTGGSSSNFTVVIDSVSSNFQTLTGTSTTGSQYYVYADTNLLTTGAMVVTTTAYSASSPIAEGGLYFKEQFVCYQKTQGGAGASETCAFFFERS